VTKRYMTLETVAPICDAQSTGPAKIVALQTGLIPAQEPVTPPPGTLSPLPVQWWNPFRVRGCAQSEFRQWTAGTFKLLLPPRQSQGTPT